MGNTLNSRKKRENIITVCRKYFRPQLFKRWIALSSGQISIQWIMQSVFLILIHWIEIYPVDTAVQLLSNRGQMFILAQKLDNSVQIVRRLLVTHDGVKLSRVGELSLAGAFTR